ncbi:MAG: alpha/beta hydrolase [Proteobacteria bacterium]|nr:alpha/beta hydrolase [Pseudomonadota bacterium]MDA1356956.1 alpha/beta hydrolase [Pseudomonadota bacterium]
MSKKIIYRDYSQEELDAQYNNRVRYPEFAGYFDDWAAWSETTRQNLPAHLDVSYGDLPCETLDIFPAAEDNAPVQVMVHGGYWYSLDKDHDSFVAEGLRPNGVTTVVINYGLAPDYGMDEIVRQNRAAVAWLWRNAGEFGVDRDRIYTVGQSAGGHLSLMLMATDWPAFGDGLPAGLVKGGASISGIYDMEPIRLCYLNDKVGMDEDVALRNAPLHQIYPVSLPLMVVSGDIESDEYARQAKAMEKAWRALSYPYEHVRLPGHNHFTMAHQLKDPHSTLTHALLRQMKLEDGQ